VAFCGSRTAGDRDSIHYLALEMLVLHKGRLPLLLADAASRVTGTKNIIMMHVTIIDFFLSVSTQARVAER